MDALTQEAFSKQQSRSLRLAVDTVRFASGVGTVVDVINLFGIANMGDNVKVCPSLKSSQLKTFVEPSPVDERTLETGRYGSIAIKALSAKSDEVIPGSIISLSSNEQCRFIDFADVTIDFNGRASMIRRGDQFVMHVHNAAYSITLEKILETLDKRTMKIIENFKNESEGGYMVRGDSLINGVIKPQERATFEHSEEYPSLGRFILTKDDEIIGFGRTKALVVNYRK